MCSCTIPTLHAVRVEMGAARNPNAAPLTVDLLRDCPEHGLAARPALWRYAHDGKTASVTPVIWYGVDRLTTPGEAR